MPDGWRAATPSGYVVYAEQDDRRYTQQEAEELLMREGVSGDRIITYIISNWRGDYQVMMLDFLKPLPHKLQLDYPPPKKLAQSPIAWWRRLWPFRTHQPESTKGC